MDDTTLFFIATTALFGAVTFLLAFAFQAAARPGKPWPARTTSALKIAGIVAGLVMANLIAQRILKGL